MNLHNPFTAAFGLFKGNLVKSCGEEYQSPVSPGEEMILAGTEAQWRMTMTNFASKDLTAGELNALVKLAGGEDKVRKILAGELKIELLPTSAQTIVVSTGVERFMTVEANLTFKDRIKRGNYCWADRDVMESLFPVTVSQIGKWEWKLFHFNQNISSKEAIRLMKEDGFEPGQIGHILTFGEINPKKQLQYPIIGLGSCAMGSFPALGDGYHRRELSLRRFANYWRDRYRFLGVRRRSVV